MEVYQTFHFRSPRQVLLSLEASCRLCDYHIDYEQETQLPAQGPRRLLLPDETKPWQG